VTIECAELVSVYYYSCEFYAVAYLLSILSFHGSIAQTTLNGDLKVWVEKELIPFLFDHNGERDIGSITYGERDFGSITDDANTMVEMLKTVGGNDELAAKIIHTMAMTQATQNLDPVLHTLAFYPYNVAMLQIALHKSRSNVCITELLEQSGYDTFLSGF
jgi:hypothetical protein